MRRAPKMRPARGRRQYKVARKIRPRDVPFAEDPPRTQAALVAAAAGESKLDAVGRPPGMGNQYGNAAFRSVFRPFLLSSEMVEVTKKRIRKSPAFHLDMLGLNFSKPQSSRADEGMGVNISVHLGGPGMNIRLGYGPNGGGNGHEPPAITVPAKPVLPAPGGNGTNGGDNGGNPSK